MENEIIIQHKEGKVFRDIREGVKKMEIRLYDEKRQKINLGQKIKIISRDDEGETLLTKVIGLSRFPDFESLFRVFEDKIKDYEKEILRRVYSKEQEKKYGVLVIHFKLV